MIIRKKTLLVLTGIMIGTGVLMGCQKEAAMPPAVEAVTAEVEAAMPANESLVEAIELSDWNGSWNNMGAYLDDEELQEAFEELAQREGSTQAEVKKEYQAKRHVDFDGLLIEGSKVVLFDGFESDGANKIDEAEYEYKETTTVKHGNFDTKWYNFEAVGPAKYQTILMMPVHGEELLTHFHMRYGNDLEELLAMDDWYPTFVKPNSTYDQLYDEITE